MTQQHTSATPTILATFKAWADVNLADERTIISLGYGVGAGDGESPRQLMIAVDDPTSPLPAVSSTSDQEPMTAGPPRARDHTGVVTCAIVAWNGGGTLPGDADLDASGQLLAAINDAYDLYAAIENNLRQPADGPALGLTGNTFQLLVVQVGNERLYTDQTDAGASAALIFDLKFRARI